MEPVVTLSQLTTIVGTASKLATFLQGGELQRMLSAISQVHFEAAETSLAHGRTEDAVVQLGVAYAAIRPKPKRNLLTPIFEIWDALSGTSGDPMATANAEKGSECASLIASCYKALGRYDQMKNWLEIASADADSYDTYLHDQARLDNNQRKYGGGHYAKQKLREARNFKEAFNRFVAECTKDTPLTAGQFQLL